MVTNGTQNLFWGSGTLLYMNPPDEEKDDILEVLLEQSWLHIRHVENHRLWFTNMYFLVVAGVLTYLSTQAPAFVTYAFPLLAIFLLLLAILGLVVCFKTDKVNHAYTETIENIVKDTLNIEKNGFPKYLGYLLIKKRKGIFGKIENIGFIYKFLYCISIFLWLVLIIVSVSAIIN